MGNLGENKKTTHRKRDQTMVARSGELEEGELQESGPKERNFQL